MSFDYKKMLKKELNVGLKEQKIRYGAAAAAGIASAFLGNIPLLLVAGALAASGFTRWCPVYSGLSKSTVDPNEPADAGCCGGSHHSSDHTEEHK
jgi:hypothetical protein